MYLTRLQDALHTGQVSLARLSLELTAIIFTIPLIIYITRGCNASSVHILTKLHQAVSEEERCPVCTSVSPDVSGFVVIHY